MADKEHYAASAAYEQHFNNLQVGIRGLASAWILATCAGISTLLLKETPESTWLLPAPVLIAIMCFMATVGLALLWVLDQFIYQKLLGSVFLVGLRMEQLNPSLPPTRALMVHAFDRQGASPILQGFYLIPAALFAVVTVVARGIVLTTELTPTQRSVMLGLFLGEVVVILAMFYARRRVRAQSQASALGDDFEELFTSSSRLNQLIMRNGSQLQIPSSDGPQQPPSPPRRRAIDRIVPDLDLKLLEFFQGTGR